MSSFEIPLTAVPQTFSIALAGVTYNLTVQWRNNANAGWVLDIADINDVPIISGIPLVTGADLLEQYAYLGIGGRLGVLNNGGVDELPTFDNLGTGSHLIFVTP
jgi:hypothetical protein